MLVQRNVGAVERRDARDGVGAVFGDVGRARHCRTASGLGLCLFVRMRRVAVLAEEQRRAAKGRDDSRARIEKTTGGGIGAEWKNGRALKLSRKESHGEASR